MMDLQEAVLVVAILGPLLLAAGLAALYTHERTKAGQWKTAYSGCVKMLDIERDWSAKLAHQLRDEQEEFDSLRRRLASTVEDRDRMRGLAVETFTMLVRELPLDESEELLRNLSNQLHDGGSSRTKN